MKKIIILFLTMCLAQSNSFALEHFVGKVSFVESSYMPGTILFKMDTGSITCPVGSFLRWSKADPENNKAIYVTLLTALTTGKRIRFHFDNGDTNCVGKYLHLLSD